MNHPGSTPAFVKPSTHTPAPLKPATLPRRAARHVRAVPGAGGTGWSVHAADPPGLPAAARNDFLEGLVDNCIPGDFTLRAVPGRLLQVFLDVIQNCPDALRAKTFSPGLRSRILIETATTPTARKIRVGGNGPGIPARNPGRVFNPFFTTRETGRGAGLGLCVCYRLLREVGAQIFVRSEAEQHCEFTLSFPAGATDARASAPLAEPHHPITVT